MTDIRDERTGTWIPGDELEGNGLPAVDKNLILFMTLRGEIIDFTESQDLPNDADTYVIDVLDEGEKHHYADLVVRLSVLAAEGEERVHVMYSVSRLFSDKLNAAIVQHVKDWIGDERRGI